MTKRFRGAGGLTPVESAALAPSDSRSGPVEADSPGSAAGRESDESRSGGKRSRTFTALDRVSITVPPGETVAVVGPNGSGKTTLMKILAGVMHPDEGSVEVRGRVGALLELGAGFHPDLSGRENIFLNAAVLGLRRQETAALLPEIAAFAELEDFLELPVRHYSSGMVVRLGFAIAAQLQSDILLLDETFSVGDARFQKRALEKIRGFKSAGRTQVLVSHDTEMLRELADRAVWLDRGRIVRDGPAAEVLGEYERSAVGGESGGAGVGGRSRAEAAASNALPVVAAAEWMGPPGRDRFGGEGDGGADGGSDAGRTERALELQSEDALALKFEIETARSEAVPEEIILVARFVREDGLIAAESRTLLPAPDSVEPREFAEPDARFELTLRFDPIRLAHGIYEASLWIEEQTAPGHSPAEVAAASDAFIVPRRIKVTTAPPFPGFRKVADLPAAWT